MNKNSLNVIFVILIVFLFFSVSELLTHCAWIETPITANINQEIKFDVFWADPDDEIYKRDFAELTLKVRNPVGKINNIRLIDRKTFYLAKHTFEMKGEYAFFAVRPPARYRISQYRDFAKSITWAGIKNTSNFTQHNPVGLDLEIIPLFSLQDIEMNNKLNVKVYFLNQPLSNAEVKVLASTKPHGRIFPDLHNKSEYEVVVTDNSGKAILNINQNFNYIIKVKHEVPSNQLNENLSFLIRRVFFRSTLFLPAKG